MVDIRLMARVLPGWIALAGAGELGCVDLKLGGQALQDVRERHLNKMPVKQGFDD